MIPDKIAKEIEGPITDKSLKKIRINYGVYEWIDSGLLISNDGPTMLYLVFKNINPDTRIGVFNLKYEIGKTILSKFGNNGKDLIDDM